jgi:hypothetical protein
MSGRRIESSSPRSNGDSNRFGPTRVSLPHDICRSRFRNRIQTQTYIYQPVPRSPKTWTDLRYPGAQYPLYYVVCPWRIRRSVLHSTPTISIRLVHNYLFKLRINRGKGLLEYVASTSKSRTQQAYNEQSLIDTGGGTTLRLHSQCKLVVAKPPAWSHIKRIHDHSHISGLTKF